MPHTRSRLLLLALLLWGVISSGNAFASFSPTSNITVHVYRLEPSGALWIDPATGAYHLCSSDDTFYGCTAISSYAYPYSTNPVTIPIETDYLLAVVPSEVSV